ncbi:unnamed protein product, partial [Rotaria sp. Silwood1]
MLHISEPVPPLESVPPIPESLQPNSRIAPTNSGMPLTNSGISPTNSGIPLTNSGIHPTNSGTPPTNSGTVSETES